LLTLLQIAKLLIIPFVCFVESFFLGRTFTGEVVGSIVLVILGVAVASAPLAAPASCPPVSV
jgi:solute carrier family 35 protein E3